MEVINVSMLIPFIFAIILVFIGINENVDTKNYEKKSLLIMYGLLYFLFAIFEGNLTQISLIVMIIFLLNGLAYLQSERLTLEKEISLVALFFYTIIYWFFKVKIYIIINCLALLFIINIFIIQNQVLNFITILMFFLSHFMINTKDQFGINCWLKVKDKINLKKGNVCEHHEFLGFILFMEDKHLFERRTMTFGPFDILNGLKNMKNNKNRTLKRYVRGYSTLPQQVIRRTMLKENSYRYTIRRKLFVEIIITNIFSKAWCNLSLRSYKKADKKNIRRNLYKNLKYRYLEFYYTDILKEPKSEYELFEEMSKQSGIKISIYKAYYAEYVKVAKKKNVKILEDIKKAEQKYSV